jgi:hypothetical protein
MFNIFTDAIENALAVVGDVITGEDVSARQVARLISDGMTIAAVASATGLAVKVIEKMIEGDA